MQGELQTDILKVMTKRFSSSAKVWLAAIQLYVHQKNVAAAQAWLERAVKALPQRKHVKVLSLAPETFSALGSASCASCKVLHHVC